MTTALITGATGFLGQAVVRAARDAGWNLHATLRSGTAPPGVATVPIADAYAVEGAMRAIQPDVVLHLAAPLLTADPRTTVEAAVGLPAAIAAGAEDFERPPIVIETASWSEWTEQAEHAPLNAYAAAKAGGREMLAQAHRRGALSLTTLIIHDVYGPNDPRSKILPKLLQSAHNGDPVALTDGQQVLDWLHVDDAAEAVIASALSSPSSDSAPKLFAASSELYDLRSVTQMIEDAGGRLMLMWGAVPHPPYARSRPGRVAPPPPQWQAHRRLRDYIESTIKKAKISE